MSDPDVRAAAALTVFFLVPGATLAMVAIVAAVAAYIHLKD